ncbi:MAG: alpha/beta hydrolase, partial [Crocinitomicaceae bacterium]|nr:alpha/beta hydrolase [Crocinitomicaceae bacterium]
NRVYQQAGLEVTVEVQNNYQTTVFTDSILSNPSKDKDRFTNQMAEIRNEYFDEFLNRNPKSYYIFLTNGFVDESIVSYSIRNKAVAFVKADTEDLFRIIAKELGYGIGALEDTWVNDGPEKGTTDNLMDVKGIELTYAQWEAIQLMHESVSYYDDYEDVRTSNGIIAHYLWEEDANGNIIMNPGGWKKSIRRPFKKNTYSLHLNIDNFLFIQLFDVYGYPICFLHIFSLLLLGFLSLYTRQKIVRKVDRIRKYRLLRWATRLIVFCVYTAGFVCAFLLINEGYFMYEVNQGELEEYQGMSVTGVSRELVVNENNRRSQEKRIGSQILIKKGDKWNLVKKKRVLYFELKESSSGGPKCRLVKDSDYLTLEDGNFKRFALNHYIVFNCLDSEGKLIEQKVFNHIGLNLTEKLKLADPAKRVLVFVNGYRPTSLGKTFKDNFGDIKDNGLEFSDSKNILFPFDRYDYWKPWNQINLLFEKRLNPSDTYYADGHHSVSTANHRSLVEFTTLSQKYPKRCRNPNHHICKRSEKSWSLFNWRSDMKTVELHNLEPNKEGFNIRRENGRIAGKNLIQQLNELPNKSKNDTLYIVAHSMGYAYSLGLIDKLRDKINFGGLYIIAAENAESGKVIPSEWQEVWQYGSDFEA